MERLVLAQSLEGFTPGSELYYYFSLLGQLQANASLSASDLLTKFAASHPSSTLLQSIQLRTLLADYDRADPSTKITLLTRLNRDYLHLSLDAPEPVSAAQATSKYPNELDPKALQADLEKASKDPGYFSLLSVEEQRQVNVAEVSIEVFAKMVETTALRLFPEVLQRLAREIEADRRWLHASILSKLTLTQIQELITLCPRLKDEDSIIARLFLYQFPISASDSPQEKVSTLLKALEWTSSLAPKFTAYRKQVLFDVLSLTPVYGQYREDLFVDYIHLHSPGSIFTVKSALGEDCRVERCLFNRHDDLQLIHLYLQRILASKDTPALFSPYFDSDYLAKEFATAKIMAGGDPTAFSLPPTTLESVSDLVILELAPDNSQVFARTDEVCLKLYVKNVPKLIVRALELNALAYSLEHSEPVPDNVDLDGLEAIYQEVVDYSAESKWEKREKAITVPVLKGKAGLFAVEFFGNGRRTRVLIKKGALKLVSRVTAAGHQLTVLNEGNQVCVTPGSGLYLNSRFYALSDSQRSVVVPFRGSQSYSTAVITDGEVTDCVTFLHRAESYELKCGFVLMEESLLMGAMASFAVQPKLFVSGLPGPSQLMKEMIVTVTIVDMEGISSEKKFPQTQLSEGLIQLEFEVPAKAVLVTLRFACQVTPMTASKPLVLTTQRDFHVNQNCTSKSCKQLFLRRSEGQYYVQVLGKNGETKAKEVVLVWLQLLGGREVPDTHLATTEFGLVKLGPLESAALVRVSLVEDPSVVNQWSLASFRPVVQYPGQLVLCEGDSFGLPLRRKGDLNAPLSTVEAEMQTCAEDGTVLTAGTAGIRFEPEAEMLVLENLKAGGYKLILASETQVIIEVLKGAHWGNNQYILTDSQVVQTYKQYRSLMIRSAELQESLLHINLTGDYEHAKVHVLLHSFLSSSQATTYQGLARLTEAKPSDAIPNPSDRSRYQASSALSEEYRYVLERKLQEKFTGNNLPKPQLLLRPASTQVTTSSSSSLHPMMADMYCSSRGADPFAMSSAPRFMARVYTEQSHCADFLLNPAIGKLACPVSAEGSVTLEIPVGEYTLATILAVNEDSSAFLTVDLGSLDLKTRDLALRLPLSPKKTYAETRKCSVVTTTEELAIADVAGASLQLVDSVGKLAQLLIQVSKISGKPLQVDDWDFLGTWHKLTPEEKNKKYDQFCSHELNLFLYMKDQAYFQAVVRPFLASKMEKMLVDKFLLGESLEEYMANVGALNTLEKILLIARLEEAKGLAETLMSQAKVLPRDEAVDQRIFDAVLKFNIQGGDEQEEFIAAAKKAAEVQQLQQYHREQKEVMGYDFVDAEQSEALSMPTLQGQARGPMYFGEAPMRSMEVSFGMPESFDMGPPRMPMAMAVPRMTRAMAAPKMQMAAPEMQMAMATSRMAQPERMSAPRGDKKGGDKKGGKKSGSARPQVRELAKEAEEMTLGYDEEDASEGSMGELDSATMLAQREAQRPYFQQMDSTKEYSETHYYGLKNLHEYSTRVPLSLYWAEVAQAAKASVLTVLSPSVLHCTANLTTFIVALAFSDLPLQPAKHGFLSQGLGIRIKAASQFLAFHKSMDEAPAAFQGSALCAQRFFHPQDRYFTNASGEREERPVKEFLVGSVYGSQVIVTNISVASLPAHVLVQIPEGALPVATQDYTKSHIIGLKSYETKTVEYYFYFPAVGDYPQAPVNVSVGGEVICVSHGFKFTVVASKSVLLEDSLKDLATSGDMDRVVSYLRKVNPYAVEVNSQLSCLLWMLRDSAKYMKLIELLREMQCFHKGVWAYAFVHADEQGIRELLAQDQSFQELVGAYFSSSLVSTGLQAFKHFDYSPMVNARAYRLANQTRIANDQFRTTYRDSLFHLAHKAALSTADYFTLIQYFLYQDRVIEAKALIPKLGMSVSEGSPGTNPLQLQYDYLVCYLEPEVARTVSQLYRNYPVTKWRELFALVSQQFEEEKTEQQTAELVSSSLSFTIERGQVKLTYANISTCYVRLYEIDIEVLFSRNPFFMKDTELFTYVCPNAVYPVALDPHGTGHVVELEEKWTRLNIFVEVEYEGKKLFQTYFASDLICQVMQSYGLVQVTDSTGRGLPRTYVKVFSKDRSGQTAFYKDGYTDVRGKFDYVSLNTSQLNTVESFALLVTHDSLGAAVLTAKPPAK